MILVNSIRVVEEEATSLNIIFTHRTYVLGPAVAGHPACAGSCVNTGTLGESIEIS